MSIFSNIVDKIFHGGNSNPPNYKVPTVPTPLAVSVPQNATPNAALQNIDVSAVLSGLAAKSSEKLNWKESIVDLMKLLGLDSSLTSRKKLAEELHYTGDQNDSAQMNLWLQKQVMTKLTENGGKVPPELMN